MKVLVTGGAGYIGSHTVVELLEAGHKVVVADNLCNGSEVALQRAEEITGAGVEFVRGDIRDRSAMDAVFAQHDIDAVIHFAGLKAVGESVGKPLTYYENNVHGTLVLCQAMEAAGVRRIVFSSSATVYGSEAPVPYVETTPRGTTSNPYGTSKAMVEKLLEDLVIADERWSVVLLRYFNPIGAHPSGRIGEDPQGIPNNLMPFIAQVAVGRRDELTIFGDDYETADGTCERDYLHVVDLAVGHLKALKAVSHPGVSVYNLGTGQGVSVLEMVNSFTRVTGVGVPYRLGARRAGDLPAFWANADKARMELGWSAEKTLDDMMADTWRWQSGNPRGYDA
ncbi:UDP-glucose 4-epimerase GalE [Halomonas organivorans]|uniref:UDP-glucose 4-epimerase n=1 Tax=Halomonas organivorans TaxID=257772 RepID=A0A7W5C4A9_9GAMM|nr:UDP-glucose 4-epimerase GalE [Halomonas organivorans]MBB3143488.1 UDP-glucose 4-epimerase [Halomonas organivorans]